ncbi:hypothetical protein FKP32DRAFT_44717 [Trametes sanguinea]|nr:hypothetical protein FKP32DRAFT_44717 [Trametes sanguinea]
MNRSAYHLPRPSDLPDDARTSLNPTSKFCHSHRHSGLRTRPRGRFFSVIHPAHLSCSGSMTPAHTVRSGFQLRRSYMQGKTAREDLLTILYATVALIYIAPPRIVHSSEYPASVFGER